MKKASKKIISALLIIPFFFGITFCCCLEKDADASDENGSIEHYQKLEKSDYHSEHQHQHSDDQDECSCPKHSSFLSGQTFDLSPVSYTSQILGKISLVPVFDVVILSFAPLYAKGPPWQDRRDYTAIPLFLKNSNLRI